MHVYFSGIGGTAIGPLALIAKEAGYTVSGSDKQDSQYIHYLRDHGIENIKIGQTTEQIKAIHDKRPIDWFVYSSAVIIENPDAPELRFCQDHNIKITKRDKLINYILKEKNLKLIAIAGTHGKTTTTAMVIWLFKQLGVPVSYSVGAKISFGDMGQYQPSSEYFVYECDEFDRNFLAFKPYLSLISGVTWDHHEIFPTREDYQQAFRDFITGSQRSIVLPRDMEYLELQPSATVSTPDNAVFDEREITLLGQFNREDAWLATHGVSMITGVSYSDLIEHINKFPGLQRRMEEIVPNVYSDYAHTPEKVRGAMSVALETAQQKNQDLIVIYEPLTNRRQHYLIDEYKDCFAGAQKLYWLPSYLAREDPNKRHLTPSELISHLHNPEIAEPRDRDDSLEQTIREHVKDGDMVVAMTGGGGDSLDEWLRNKFKA